MPVVSLPRGGSLAPRLLTEPPYQRAVPGLVELKCDYHNGSRAYSVVCVGSSPEKFDVPISMFRLFR